MLSDPAPPYEALRPGIHLEEDGKIHLEISDDLADLWETLPAIDEDPTFQARPTNTPSTKSEENQPRVPRLNILMLVVGSRGDVQPFIVLATALIKYGHRVRMATHGTFGRWVESRGIEFFDLGGSPVELMAYMVQNPGLLPKFAAWRKGDVLRNRRTMSDMINASWRACFEPGRSPDAISSVSRKSSGKVPTAAPRKTDPVPFVADAIIANPPAVAHIHCAEKLGIPLHIFFTMPWSPTACIPHPLASITAPAKQRGQVNKMSYLLVEGVIWQGLGGVINNFRYNVLQMDPIHPSRGPSLVHTARIPHTYAWSPSLLPRPSDWSEDIAVSGYLSLESSENYSPPKRLEGFLQAGKPPVYIGFGSIVVSDPLKFLDLAVRAAHATGNRVILATGWSSSDRPTISQASYAPSDTLILHEDCPHDWLFPRVACVVHHGGAGTTAAGLKAGKPTVVIPFFGDQFFWGERVAQAGAGPAPIPHGKLTLENLSEAIRFALLGHTVERAAALAASLTSEDGIGAAVESFHSHLPRTGMRCRLLPSRAATWKHKNSEMILSTAAAAVLQRERLIDLKELELHRKMDLNVAHGPYEPASGAAWAITELFLNSFQGMGEILAEVGYMPVSTYRMFERLGRRRGGSAQSDTPTPPPGDAEMTAPFVQDSAKPPKRQKLPGEYFVTGSARIGKAAVRAPGEFAAAMANGAHSLPLVWGDKTVRPAVKVTGFGSGMAGGCKSLFWGVADGVSGLFVQPVMGLVKEGPAGLAKGTVSGVLGLPVKFFEAASGVVGYPLKGIDLALSRALKKSATAAVVFQAKLQGEYEYFRLSEAEKTEVLERWHGLLAQHAGQINGEGGVL